MKTVEEMVATFMQDFKCIHTNCDGRGNIPHQTSEDEWEAEQCQFCYEFRFKVEGFLHLVDENAVRRTKQEDREIVRDFPFHEPVGSKIGEVLEKISNLILNHPKGE